MAMKAQFNNIDEFLEELAQESDQVTDRILRVTCLHTQQPGMPITQLSVVAGARVRGVLLEFVTYCGDLWRMREADDPTTQRARDLLQRLDEAAQRLDLQIRRGRFLTTKDEPDTGGGHRPAHGAP